MDCVRAKEQMNMYVDDMLGEAETKELLAHVSSCASCQKDLDATLALKSALGGLDEQTPPLGLASSAIHRAKKSRVPAIAFISAGVAAAVVVVAVTVGVLSGGSFPQRLGDTMAVADESTKANEENGETFTEDTAGGFAVTDDAASDITMEAAMADDSITQDAGDAAAADDTTADAPMTAADDADTGSMDEADGAMLDYCFIVVTPENAAFFDMVYTFVTEAGIETEQFELEFGSVMSFIIDEENFDAFVSMVGEEEIAFNGVLYPGCYVEIRYIKQ